MMHSTKQGKRKAGLRSGANSFFLMSKTLNRTSIPGWPRKQPVQTEVEKSGESAEAQLDRIWHISTYNDLLIL